jgi:hypothetical protein
MRRYNPRIVTTTTVPLSSTDDADAAAGALQHLLPTAPMSRGGMSTATSASDIEFYEDLISDPVLVLGIDISHLSRGAQFVACATGVFFFTLLYGYVELCSCLLAAYASAVVPDANFILCSYARTHACLLASLRVFIRFFFSH